MPKLALLLSFLFITRLATSQQQALFRITEKGKTGYINSSGATVIPPIYHNGFDFVEGLAAVRENELYGFIDSSGKYVIPPQFDYATYFEKGITLVYKQRKPYFIDKTGKVILPDVYQSMEFIDDRKAIVKTSHYHEGIIDVRTGRLLCDTIYTHIHSFNNGVAIVDNDDRYPSQGLIDASYNLIVPFHVYETIFPFENGYANVTINTKKGIFGAIDSTGKLVLKIKKNDTTLFDANYKKHNFGLTVAYRNNNYMVLDRSGKQLGSKSFKRASAYFKNYAIVKTDEGVGIIDTNANFIIPPQYDDIFFPDSTVEYFFFTKQGSPNRYGLADLNNKVTIQPVMEFIHKEGFVNGLLSAIIDGRESLINKQGRIVWQESKEDIQTLRPMNIDFAAEINQNENYYPYRYIHPANHEGYRIKTSRYVTAADGFNENEFFLKIDTSKTDTFPSSPYYANTLIVGNTTKDTINVINAGAIAMRLEALNEEGAWKRIEFFQISRYYWGYNISFLSPGTYWPFKIPKYEGGFTTKIRAALQYEDKNEKVQTIYSNVIDASINRTQFWRSNYSPRGVFDYPFYPYDMNLIQIGKNK